MERDEKSCTTPKLTTNVNFFKIVLQYLCVRYVF